MSRFMIGRRGAAVLAGVATAALTLSACGVASTESGGSGGELTLWTHNAGNPAELAVVNQIVADYNASQSNYKVKLQAFPQESYNDSVVAAATAKKLPCVLDTDAPTVPNWAYAGYLSPLDLPQDLVSKQLKSTLGNYRGKLYSIGLYDAALGLFAHKSALTAAGVRIATVDKPWTAQEFADALAKIKAAGKFKYAFDLGTGDSGTEWWTASRAVAHDHGRPASTGESLGEAGLRHRAPRAQAADALGVCGVHVTEVGMPHVVAEDPRPAGQAPGGHSRGVGPGQRGERRERVRIV
jgi:multiple sugar transport system substrate-binding protein